MTGYNYLKDIINKIIKMYDLLLNTLFEENEDELINLTSKIKLLYLKAKKIMSFFDKKQLDTLYFNAQGNILELNLTDEDKKLYYFVINYYERRFNQKSENALDNNALIYAYKNMYDILIEDTLFIRSIDSDAYDDVKKCYYRQLYEELLTNFNLEAILINSNFNIAKLKLQDLGDEVNVQKESYWQIKSLINQFELKDVNDSSFDSLITLLKRKLIFNFYLNLIDKTNIENLINFLNYKNDGSNKTLSIYDTLLKGKGR